MYLPSKSFRRLYSRASREKSMRGLKPIDQAGHNGSAKAIIDVDDGHVGRATIEHAEQGGDAVKACAVADACRNGDYRYGDESSDHTRECAFHSRRDYKNSGTIQLFAAI